jgi:FAD/FMN-containing dehydrogenase
MTELQIDGTLYKPGDDAYEHARTRNFAVNAHNRENSVPAFIAQVKNVSDIQKCIAYAKEHKLSVTVRSGGHNWFGSYLQQDSMLIDMKDFCSLEIDEKSKSATIGPCVLGQILNQEAAKVGLCFSSGHCTGVPLGGYLLGGGLGWFSEYYGYAAESVETVTIVTPQGQVIEASSDGWDDENDNADWLWLARGAASTFPGVAVSFKLKLYPVPPIVRNAMG